MTDIQLLREQIEEINLQILHLLNKRTGIVLQIRDKKVCGGIPLFDPQRESEMIKKLQDANRGPLPNDMIQNIFQEILQNSRDCMKSE